ncbi:MAG TPA: quinone-interacting membrane-bound oxidoreductase complex subunit QmoC [Candidatus Acidoferrales bacterium]|nr:quinone-interacting membrane-bound oxidoreductase complex subunit QmoC [Candidatus Acidoferrales bacterium]
MAIARPVEPDLEFKRQILAFGAHDLSSCYQCGTCSVVCPLSTPGDPFPRKEMLWVQWGLKDRLVADASVWMCHQCGACSTYCPREAKPADVMAALRDYNILHYAVPRFMGRAIREPRWLPLLLAFPAVLLLAVLASLGHLAALPAGTVVFSKFFPVRVIENFYDVAVGFAVLVAILGGLRYWNALRKTSPAGEARASRGLVPTLAAIFKHARFKQCRSDRVGTRPTYKSHLFAAHAFIFYGFLGLVATTASVGIGIYAFHYLTPWPLWHPVKILGNLSGLAVIAACSVFLVRRIQDGRKAGKSTYTDWLFLSVLGLTVLTGYLSEATRLSGVAPLAYWTYFVHLVLVFFLLVYLPYSKFAHLVYRFVAMLHSASRPPGQGSEADSVLRLGGAPEA